jgi:hypothetical protein
MLDLILVMIRNEQQLSFQNRPQQKPTPDSSSQRYPLAKGDSPWLRMGASDQRCFVSVRGAERNCQDDSLPAAIGEIPEELCSPRVLLAVTDAVEK